MPELRRIRLTAEWEPGIRELKDETAPDEG